MRQHMRPFGFYIAALLLFTGLAVQAIEPTRHAMVPMTDGTRLATDIYLPEGEGPWPVLVLRSTYSRWSAVRGFLGSDFRARGYAGVVQDVRGMGMSEGDGHVFFYDGWRKGLTDGADTIAWVREQPWCDGHVGTYGTSAMAMTQMLMAPVTPGIGAQYVNMTPSSYYFDVVYPGGVFRQNLVELWLFAVGQHELVEFYRERPYYTAFWHYYDVEGRAADITAPAVFVTGWYDIFQQGAIDGFVSREKNGGPGARGSNYLIIKPGGHQHSRTKDYAWVKDERPVSFGGLRNAFYDYHLKGKTGALDGMPKVMYFTLGEDSPDAPGNAWRTAETWPPFETNNTPWYLHADGSLSPEAPGDAAASRGFEYDPGDPYPTLGGNNLFQNIEIGPFDQRKHSKTRTDLLKFASAPLEEPLEVTGRVRVRLFVSTDAPDTDFTAKFLDVFPDGREINILDGIQRVKLRKDYAKPEPLLEGPERIVEIEIDLWSTSWILNTGHRAGLHVSSSNYPRFEPNPNTGADHPEAGEEKRTAHNAVHMDAAHPSAIVLPVRPAE